ncbi:MAG: DoxX family protein [Flavobacteriaceae bacterium]|nr:DoxX family protein [Flavobacteriaceae bacterium]
MKYIKLLTIYFMSLGYSYAGFRHFVDPDFFLAIMPNYLSFHLEIVYLSGVAEIIFGILLLFKKTRTFASYGLIFLLICVFPANIHLVQSELSQSILNATKNQTIIRLPFQGLFILLAYWHSKNN